MMLRRWLAPALLAFVATAAPPAMAQVVNPGSTIPYTRAVAAGYKALMLCSGVLNARVMGANRTPASVEAHELQGIYSEYQPLLAAMQPSIGRDRVSVRYGPEMPPRVAIHRGRGGCTLLPIGAQPGTFSVQPFSDTRSGAWPTGDPAALTPLPQRLVAVADRAFAGGFGEGSRTTALVVIRDGKLLGERYAEGFGPYTPQRTWSVAKSIAGTLAGIGVARRLIDPRAPAPIPEWQAPGDPRRAITIDQLLRMASGLHSDTAGNRTDAIYFGGTAVTEDAVFRPLAVSPGSRFRYANNDTLLAVRALRARIGRDAFAGELLFAPLGMARTIAEQDWRGNYVLSSQVWTTARDLARIGQFWLQDGVWQGKRLLPAGWMRYMTTPTLPQPANGPGYGATLWLFGPEQGLPIGTYAALGNRGQMVMVVPSYRLVVVRRGEDPAGKRFDEAAFVAEVLKALG